MEIPLYLAMTAAEFAGSSLLPRFPAWMACHFSPYGTGISNLPPALPEGAMVILNDRIPPQGHDPGRIVEQLKTILSSSKDLSLLLDFQRPECCETRNIAAAIVDALGAAVGLSHHYARGIDCPVFLPVLPFFASVEQHFSQWSGREIWLEMAQDCVAVTVTESGSNTAMVITQDEGDYTWEDAQLHCHYGIKIEEKQAVFTLKRTKADLNSLLNDVQTWGVTRAVGLWQELQHP